MSSNPNMNENLEQYIDKLLGRVRWLIKLDSVILIIGLLCVWYWGFSKENPKSMRNADYFFNYKAYEKKEDLEKLSPKTNLEKKLIESNKITVDALIGMNQNLAYPLAQATMLLMWLPVYFALITSFRKLSELKKMKKMIEIRNENN